MLAALFSHLKFLRDAFFTSDSARQLAAGVTLGLFLGLIPKGNLLAFGLSVALFGTMVNLGTGMITALCVGFIAQFSDPLAHEIGVRVLTQPQLAVIWQWLATFPVIPWTRFNNTVVMGNLVLASLLAVPTYRLSWRWFDRKMRVAEAASEAAASEAASSEAGVDEAGVDEAGVDEAGVGEAEVGEAGVGEAGGDVELEAPVESDRETLTGEPRIAAGGEPVELPPSKPKDDAPELEKTLAAESSELPDAAMEEVVDEGTESADVAAPAEPSQDIAAGQESTDALERNEDEKEEVGTSDSPTETTTTPIPAGGRADAAHEPMPEPKSRPRRRARPRRASTVAQSDTIADSRWRETTQVGSSKPGSSSPPGHLSIPSFDVYSSNENEASTRRDSNSTDLEQ